MIHWLLTVDLLGLSSISVSLSVPRRSWEKEFIVLGKELEPPCTTNSLFTMSFALFELVVIPKANDFLAFDGQGLQSLSDQSALLQQCSQCPGPLIAPRGMRTPPRQPPLAGHRGLEIWSSRSPPSEGKRTQEKIRFRGKINKPRIKLN